MRGRSTRWPQAARLFHALSDPTRLAILDLLGEGERCVCDLQAALNASQPRLSFHLRVLREAGLVRGRREGRWSYYAIKPAALVKAHDIAVQLQPSGAGRETPIGRCCR
jgi:ArsR family transcriptional regulator